MILPEEAAKRAGAAKMSLPGILDLNGQYFIKVDDSAILLDVKTLDEAIGYLVAYYYILHIKYPPTLKFVLGFFERLFEIEPTFESVNGKKTVRFPTM